MAFNRLLLAIKDEAQRDLYQSSLEEEGFGVQATSDGEEAFDLFTIEGQDVVVADAELPGIDGISLLEKIRRVNDFCGLILIAGADLDLSDKLEILEKIGAQDVLRRPFNVITLLCSIENRIEKMKLAEASALDEQPLTPDVRLRELEIKLEDYRSKVRDLTRELGLREGQEEKLENLRNLVRSKEKALVGMRDELGRAREELQVLHDDYRQRAELYQKTIDGLMVENKKILQDLEKKVIRHTKQLELLSTDSEQVSENYEQKIAEMQTELEMLRSQKRELEKQKEQASSALENLERSCNDKLIKRDQSFREEKKELEARLAERDRAVTELEDGIKEATSKIRALELEREEAEKEYNEKIAELTNQVPAERKKVQTLLDYQQTIIRNLFSGFLSVDEREKITLTNKVLGEIISVPLGRLIGEKLSTIKELEPVLPYFRNAMKNGDEVSEQVIDLNPSEGDPVKVLFRCRKVKFGTKDMCLLLFNRIPEAAADSDNDKASVDAVDKDLDLESNPIYAFGASAAADIVDVKDQLLQLRKRVEQTYSLTPPDSALRETVNLLLNDISDTLDFIKNVTDRAEDILA